MADNIIRIGWMYPDTLYLHGERGNILALERYAGLLGLEAVTDRIDLGTEGFDPMEYDILFFGPGEISVFNAVRSDISGYERSIAEFIASGKILIATGTSAAMFGESIVRLPDADSGNGRGEFVNGLCLVPFKSYEREYVAGDDEWITAWYDGYEMELIGHQIMMTDMELSESSVYSRFGTVIYGRGNNGSGDKSEGALYGNSIFTNMLGPVLVHNPWLTVRILRKAAGIKGIEITADDPDYGLEVRSFNLKKEFIINKMQKSQASQS